jgi:hypothetical protein
MDKPIILWPSWRYGPNGEAQIFEKAEDVPKGWEDHPSKFEKKTEIEEVAEEAPEPKRKSKK